LNNVSNRALVLVLIGRVTANIYVRHTMELNSNHALRITCSANKYLRFIDRSIRVNHAPKISLIIPKNRVEAICIRLNRRTVRHIYVSFDILT
jgi:hypothetical protein